MSDRAEERLYQERLYKLNSTRPWFPRRRRGKRPTLPTLYRWSNEGYRGVVLETVQVGSTRCTSKEACIRFLRRISDLSPSSKDTPVPFRPTSGQQIDKALEEAGFDRRPSGLRASYGQMKAGLERGSIPPSTTGSVGGTSDIHAPEKGGSR